MIVKVRFPEPIDIRDDGNPASVWLPGVNGLRGVAFPGNGSVDSAFFRFEGEQFRLVILPRGTIVHYCED